MLVFTGPLRVGPSTYIDVNSEHQKARTWGYLRAILESYEEGISLIQMLLLLLFHHPALGSMVP